MHINKPQRAQMINLTVLLQTTARVPYHLSFYYYHYYYYYH